MTVRLKAYPDAHIYHYAAYEETALKRLAMFHGTREGAVDDLLRGGKLVDLYKVVREAIRVGQPRYSLKNLEAYYLKIRGLATSRPPATALYGYERWRRAWRRQYPERDTRL